MLRSYSAKGSFEESLPEGHIIKVFRRSQGVKLTLNSYLTDSLKARIRQCLFHWFHCRSSLDTSMITLMEPRYKEYEVSQMCKRSNFTKVLLVH